MKNEKGFALIELLVSITLLGVIAASLYSALSVATVGSVNTDVQLGAQNWAELQMEYVKNQPYNTTYSPTPIPADFPDFVTTINATHIPSRDDNNIQKITVVITYQGKTPATLEGYKVMR
jgi:prepilin-type N-terminal cleavage/methylation domain-containing protein